MIKVGILTYNKPHLKKCCHYLLHHFHTGKLGPLTIDEVPKDN